LFYTEPIEATRS